MQMVSVRHAIKNKLDFCSRWTILVSVRKGKQMTYKEQCEDFAIRRATEMVGELTAEMITRIKNQPAIAERVGMYFVGNFNRAEINLAKLDELLNLVLN